MKIAYISYEHPLGISGGGIGTYIGQIAQVMASRGNAIEVFAGVLSGNYRRVEIDNYVLHLIPAVNANVFRQKVLPIFSERNAFASFDIIESTEFGADGLEIRKAFPDIPLTVKLHTPAFLISELNDLKNAWYHRARFVFGGMIRRQLVTPYWHYNQYKDPEFELVNSADSVSSPSTQLASIVAKRWSLERDITVLPYPFQASDALKNIPVVSPGEKVNILFVGKLEKRKGVLDMMDAIPLILRENNKVSFKFVGKSHSSPNSKLGMEDYIKRKLNRYLQHLEFSGPVSYSKIPAILSSANICIFPSLWENFPNVCLEAMSAGRVVIGTNNGGMADMIKSGINGYLVKPNSPASIAKTVLEIINSTSRFHSVGVAARETIDKRYNSKEIGELTEAFYYKTIQIANGKNIGSNLYT